MRRERIGAAARYAATKERHLMKTRTAGITPTVTISVATRLMVDEVAVAVEEEEEVAADAAEAVEAVGPMAEAIMVIPMIMMEAQVKIITLAPLTPAGEVLLHRGVIPPVPRINIIWM